MLMFPAGRPLARGDADRSARAPGRGGARALAGAVGLALGVVSTTTLVRLRSLRRSAAVHAHDLDHTAIVGEGMGEEVDEPVRLLVLGDSAARGYGLREVADTFPHQLAGRLAAATGRRVHVTSLATDGHRTLDLLTDQAPRVRTARPDAVVVSVGVNDAIRMTPRDELETATRALFERLRAAHGGHAADGGPAVVFVTCPDLGAAPGFPRPLNLAVGWRCRRVARVQQVVAREMDVPTIRLPRPDATMFGADGFHPGAAGHAAMAEVTIEELRHQVGVAPPPTVVSSASGEPNGATTWTSG